MTSLAPMPKLQFLDANGTPLVGGKVYTYAAGTTTPLAAYTDVTGAAPHTNPIILDAAGEAVIWLSSAQYKMKLTTSTDVEVWTVDNIYGTAAALDLFGGVNGSSYIGFTQAGTNVVERTSESKMREWVSVDDFISPSDALSNANTTDTIIVPLNGTTVPASVANKNILWEYVDGGDADNVLTSTGTRGGLFADYNCVANKVYVSQLREDQSAILSGGFRDCIFVNAVDNDLFNYSTAGYQKVTHSIRAQTQGAYTGSAYTAQYKDLVGGYFAAMGNIQWANRGVSGVTADAYQYGIGIASNEFAVHNPSASEGSLAQSYSMAGVQAIVRSRYADEDASHVSRGVFVTNNGYRITSGVALISDTSAGFTSTFKFGLDMSAASIYAAAIYMPFSAAGNAGTIIQYDADSYSWYDRTNKRFNWTINGVAGFAVTANGISVGSSTTSQTRVFIEPSTTALSHMLLYPGATPVSPNNGEIWFDGTNLKMVIGGVVKTFTLT